MIVSLPIEPEPFLQSFIPQSTKHRNRKSLITPRSNPHRQKMRVIRHQTIHRPNHSMPAPYLKHGFPQLGMK